MPQTEQEKLLDIQGLYKQYPARGLGKSRKTAIQAVTDISLTLYKGETYGLVGESGCGKSTLGKTILRLTEPTRGAAFYKGEDLFRLGRSQLHSLRRELQMVFQDPFASLNPRISIGKVLEEALTIHKIGTAGERVSKASEMLSVVGLGAEHYNRLPGELSGGQRQRVGLARSLILHPSLVVCDEPVSALDVIIQAQIINMLKELQEKLRLTYLFISHDISIVRHISDRIGVMYLGHLIEEAQTDELFSNTLHPYTQVLLSSIPSLEKQKKRIILKGEIPSPASIPQGCPFHTRCPCATKLCKTVPPTKTQINEAHWTACHLYQ